MSKQECRTELRFAISEEEHKRLKSEAERRGCLTLSEYVRFLIVNNPYRLTTGDLDGARASTADQVFAMLFRLGEELNNPRSFLGRIMQDRASIPAKPKVPL